MKYRDYILPIFATLLFVGCTSDSTDNSFKPESVAIEIGPEGGIAKQRITSSERWIASTDAPWITVSPANGRGTADCKFIIDSALTDQPRRGVVLIQNLATWQQKEIVIEQEGFPFTIEVDKTKQDITNYDRPENRYFDVTVKANVEFDVDIPDDAGWINNERYNFTLDRGVRPRSVDIRFKWDINTSPRERLAQIKFRPKRDVELLHQDHIDVTQMAAEPIVENSREGDSVAIVCIARALQMYSDMELSEPMNMWKNVTLWNESMKGCTPDKVGRVRKASFYIFKTRESLPYEVRYLTAADELYFFGNTNTFMLDIALGDEISELTQLKRLTIGAYGLTSLPNSLARLKNLEYLDIGSNNLQRVPEVLTKENFPALRTLILNANQRSNIYDLSNTQRTDIGGFSEEEKFPADLIKWGLDTLVLSVNYLQGELPDFEDDPEVPYYTQEEIDAVDSLPQILVDRRIKKVMPTTKRFAINLNRLSGKLPDWLLYHPALDWWIPYSLVFPQEGHDKSGRQSRFDNEPANLDYYYEAYTTKEKPTEELE